MPKRWTDDSMLLDSLASNLLTTVAMFPKRFVHMENLVRKYRMPVSQIQILALLEMRPMSIGDISDKLGIAKPNITPLIDALSQAKFAERIKSSTDRRIVMVAILPAGKERLQDLRNSISEQIQDGLQELSASDARQLQSALMTINRIGTLFDQ